MLELSLHLLDVMRNAVEAGARRVEVRVEEDRAADWLRLEVRDDGRGMTADEATRAADPFFTRRGSRRVGLGLPLLKAAAERCDGAMEITSAPGRGTRVAASFRRSHWDRAPLGDLPGAVLAALLAGGALGDGGDAGGDGGGATIEWVYAHWVDGREFRFETEAVRAALGEVPLGHPKVSGWILEALRDGEQALMDGMDEMDGMGEGVEARRWRS